MQMAVTIGITSFLPEYGREKRGGGAGAQGLKTYQTLSSRGVPTVYQRVGVTLM